MFAFSPSDLLPPLGTPGWTGGFPRPTVLSYSFATAGSALDAGQQALAQQALSLWQAASGLSFVETPWTRADFVFGFGAPGDSIVLPGAAPTLRDMLKATGAALGLTPDAPGATLAATVMAAEEGPATGLGWADVEAVAALFASRLDAENQGVRWQYDPALDALRGDIFSFQSQTVFAGTGNTALFGDIGDDLLIGGPGDDIFMGGPGTNSFLGGAGRDTVLTGVLRSEATLDFDFQRLSTPWGTDHWDQVEYLAFRDGGFALHSHEHAALVNRLYHALLLREADPTGLTTWTDFLDAGGTGEELIGRITGSDEYRDRFGPPDAAALARGAAALAPVPDAMLPNPLWVPDAEAVLAVRFHLLVLDAAPDRARFDQWLAALEAAPDHATAAQAFLDAHPGSGFADGEALLDAAWSPAVIRWTAPWVDAGVRLASDWVA
jgi:hypothetical protein